MNLLYIHIYKCGGSSMRQFILDQLHTPETVVVDQWAYEWERRLVPPDRFLGNMIRAEVLRCAHLQPPERPTVVLTHSFLYEFMKSLPAFRLGTMLRNPVERAISQYHFERREFGSHQHLALAGWVERASDFELNLQTAALCGAPKHAVDDRSLELAKANLHCFDFLGLLERFSDSQRLFARVFGVPASPSVYARNVDPARGRVEDEPVRAVLAERCRLDLELYAYAERLFAAKVAAFELIDGGDPNEPPPSLTVHDTPLR